jgi:hypothetical protein
LPVKGRIPRPAAILRRDLDDRHSNAPRSRKSSLYAYFHGRSLMIAPMFPTMVFLGRLLGLFLVAISIAMLINRRRTLATLNEMARSGPWMLFSGMVATATGLAIVLGHNVWNGGVLAIIVTLLGWAALIKGLALLLVPPEQMAAAYKGMGFERFFYVWMGAVLVFGLLIALDAFAS